MAKLTIPCGKWFDKHGKGLSPAEEERINAIYRPILRRQMDKPASEIEAVNGQAHRRVWRLRTAHGALMHKLIISLCIAAFVGFLASLPADNPHECIVMVKPVITRPC